MEALKKMRLLLLCFLSFSLICCDELLKNEEEGDEILIEKGKFSAKIPKNSLVTITTIEDNKIDFDIKNELADLYQNENKVYS